MNRAFVSYFIGALIAVTFFATVQYFRQSETVSSAPVTAEGKLPMQPPEIEVMSGWSSVQYGELLRYINIDGRLAVEVSTSSSRCIAFVPESATSAK